MKIVIGILLFILIISCQAGDIPQNQTTEIPAGKPDTIEQLFDDYFRTMIALNPDRNQSPRAQPLQVSQLKKLATGNYF